MSEKQLQTAAMIAALQACLDTPPSDRPVTIDTADPATALRTVAALRDIKLDKAQAVESQVVLGTEADGFNWE